MQRVTALKNQRPTTASDSRTNQQKMLAFKAKQEERKETERKSIHFNILEEAKEPVMTKEAVTKLINLALTVRPTYDI